MVLDFLGAVMLGFLSFAAGFSVGFFYLKHKFESHVAGVFDFESGEGEGLDEIFDEVELEGGGK